MFEELTKHYGDIFEPELLMEINQIGIFKEFKEGDVIMEIGQYMKYMPILVSGVIKVLREDTDGKELLLYFLQDGDTCAMTLVCGMGESKSEVRAVADTNVKVAMIPIEKMEEWLTKYKSWGGFVLTSYHSRLNELIDAVDSIAFMKMDKRLLKYLKHKMQIDQSNSIYITHQEIADDLNSSREVISRLLKKLESMGKVKLHRNYIQIKENQKV